VSVSVLAPSPVVGEGWGEGVPKRLAFTNKTLSLTLPHDGGENRISASQLMRRLIKYHWGLLGFETGDWIGF